MNETADDNAAMPAALRRTLLAWYDRHRRVLPWRAAPGQPSDPYRVWLSEVMLQQTTVATVGPYYRAFVERWPTVEALAAADLPAVLTAWQGLGYYARARNLHACAGAVMARHAGRFPRDEAALRQLPGIGAYTAAAVAAIAFDRPAVPLDGNVERVLARLYAIATPLPAAKHRLAALAANLATRNRAGDLAQALMDLGATVCLPGRPNCPACPWQQPCQARAQGKPERLPVRPARPERPLRHGVAFVAVTPEREVLLRRRPLKGLLGGMVEVPCSEWRGEPWSAAEARQAAPLAARWRTLAPAVEHGFTHFRLELTVKVAEVRQRPVAAGFWWPIADLHRQPLPTVIKKVLRAGFQYGE